MPDAAPVTDSLPSTASSAASEPVRRVALLGNPNTGKTTLFNRLCGLRHKTSNFPGTTQESRIGRLRAPGSPGSPAIPGTPGTPTPGPTGIGIPDIPTTPGPPARERRDLDIHLIDLPGIYSLELDQNESRICREVLGGMLSPKGETPGAPDAVCVVVDASNLARNLVLAGEVLRRRLPTVVVLNMIDVAERRGLTISAPTLESRLGCTVVLGCARSGEGLERLPELLAQARIPNRTPPGTSSGVEAWADETFQAAVSRRGQRTADGPSLTDRLDRVLVHPVGGTLAFALVMGTLFWMLFRLATYPMDWIDQFFAFTGAQLARVLPPGLLHDFLAQGVVAGIGATLIFLPQICLLFFCISLLEDTGYLARAALLMDRLLRPFGIPGHAFVPLLSAHACALPGIMACRAVPDRRERLATILVAPFMTCSARLPVYVLVTTVLFRDRPALAALAFIGCYVLGIVAGLLSALLARRTILRGPRRPMVLELPSYKRPSLRTALITTYDRGIVFLRKAGTNILAICIVLWWLGSFPRVPPPPLVETLRAQAAALEQGALNAPQAERGGRGDTTPDTTPATRPTPAAPGVDTPPRVETAPRVETPPSSQSDQPTRDASAEALRAEADRLEAIHANARSYLGRAGRALAPIFAPIGADWQLTIGILASFAAREVFASTMAVIVTGESDAADAGVLHELATATRDDGVTALFTVPASWALLVYFVLAMQCLPTLAVTARESGHAKWALLQLAWMSAVAYGAALLAYHVATWLA